MIFPIECHGGAMSKNLLNSSIEWKSSNQFFGGDSLLMAEQGRCLERIFVDTYNTVMGCESLFLWAALSCTIPAQICQWHMIYLWDKNVVHVVQTHSMVKLFDAFFVPFSVTGVFQLSPYFATELPCSMVTEIWWQNRV